MKDEFDLKFYRSALIVIRIDIGQYGKIYQFFTILPSPNLKVTIDYLT